MLNITFRSLWLTLMCLAFLGCERQASEPSPPVRPANVPVDAVWVGGMEGGVFVLIRKPEELSDDNYTGEVYYSSGDLSYKGEMKLLPPGSAAFDVTTKESFEGWDGDRLYLTGNRYLQVQE